MNQALNSGKGRCRAEARLLVTPVRAVVELGASRDVLMGALNAVHHVNRCCGGDDFIAVALPGMCAGRATELPGLDIELIASRSALERLLATDGMKTLARRGMIEAEEIVETELDFGATGAAYFRDRSGEKWTEGGIRRAQQRAARRGVKVHKITRKPVSLHRKLTLYYGSTPVHVRQVVAEMTSEPLMVSTYGFSAPGAPAVLPVYPDAAKGVEDAA